MVMLVAPKLARLQLCHNGGPCWQQGSAQVGTAAEHSIRNAVRAAEGSLEGICRTWLEEHRVKGFSSPGSSRYKYIN